MVHEERVRQIADVGIGRVEMPLAEAKSRFSIGRTFAVSSARVAGNPARPEIAAEAMPQPKEPAIEREGLPAEPLRRRRRRGIERTQQVAGHVRPAELSLADDILQIGGQAITAQDARERIAQDDLQHVGPARRRNAVQHEGPGHERPQPPFVAVRPVSRLIGVDDGLVWQGRFEFGIGRGDRGAGFLPRVLGAMPRLIGICSTPSRKRCTTNRGMRHTTVRYAISAVSCGPN